MPPEPAPEPPAADQRAAPSLAAPGAPAAQAEPETPIPADLPATARPDALAQPTRFTTSTALKRQLSGLALAWPWFDRAGLWLLKRAYFPASRLWAAAQVADADPARFYAAAGISRNPARDTRLADALARFDEVRATALAIDAEWRRVFFGPEPTTTAHRAAVETARLKHAHAYNMARRRFAFLVDADTPRIKVDVASPEATSAIYSTALDDPATHFAPPDPMPHVEVSEPIPGAVGEDRWLRFRSPSKRLGDWTWARVHSPVGVDNPPTIILGHGVCVEFDNWIGLVDEADALTAAGFRVIRPEAPFHGRRCPPGYFGGERLIGSFPLGALDAFTGAVREWAVLAQWARSTSSGRLAMGGTSLGALTAQLVADRSRDWPEALRPDGLLLITHSGNLRQTILDGELTRLFENTEAAMAKGWSPELIDTYLGLADPRRGPACPPERIVSILGRRDTVTPYPGGEPLIDRWKVPSENVFLYDRGHFSVPMTLIRDKAPVRRFVEVMSA